MSIIAKSAFVTTLLLAGASTASAQGLTAAFYGGEWGEAIQACIVDAFTKATGTKVTPDPGVSTVTLAKLRQQKGSPSIDIAWIDGGVSELAAGEDLVATINPKTVPNIANMVSEGVYKTSAGNIYALSTGFYALGLVYNTKEVKNPPTSWWDLWKPEFNGLSTMPSPANAITSRSMKLLSRAISSAGISSAARMRSHGSVRPPASRWA